jgi:hypothetical protein
MVPLMRPGWPLTVKVDFVTEVDVADSAAEDTADAASDAASTTSSARTTAAASAAVASAVKRMADLYRLFAVGGNCSQAN